MRVLAKLGYQPAYPVTMVRSTIEAVAADSSLPEMGGIRGHFVKKVEVFVDAQGTLWKLRQHYFVKEQQI